MADRETHAGRLSTQVYCQDCDYSDSGPGSQGRAAQHHDATGHRVDVDIYTSVTYGPLGRDDDE